MHPRDVHELLPVALPHRGRAQVGDAGEGEVEVLERGVEPAVRAGAAALRKLSLDSQRQGVNTAGARVKSNAGPSQRRDHSRTLGWCTDRFEYA